ncbi:hypothetical protein E2542_SST01771 [Spatholobus suberectus]|nr:hypothetical protein E2542_SST01771 [Spatholobus suberectus]
MLSQSGDTSLTKRGSFNLVSFVKATIIGLRWMDYIEGASCLDAEKLWESWCLSVFPFFFANFGCGVSIGELNLYHDALNLWSPREQICFCLDMLEVDGDVSLPLN